MDEAASISRIASESQENLIDPAATAHNKKKKKKDNLLRRFFRKIKDKIMPREKDKRVKNKPDRNKQVKNNRKPDPVVPLFM